MQLRTLGSTGLDVSILGLGCMRLPVVDGDPTRIDEDAAGALLRRAVELGVNYLDTAHPYHGGESERWLGRALTPELRRKVLVATKLPPWPVQTLDDCERILEEQLTRLATDRIDLYLLHSLNARYWPRLRDLGVLEFLERARADGRIGPVGFSFHDQLPVFREIVDAWDWAFCQIQYNYMDEEVQAGTAGLEYAAARGLGVVVMEPLRGGRLGTAGAPGLEEIWAGGPGPADTALRWVWDRPEVAVVLSGMNTTEQLEANAAAADRAAPGALPPGDRDRIHRARAWYARRRTIPCTFCQYCLPCPQGVNIPRLFELMNDAVMFGDWGAVRRRYNQFTPADEIASHCVSCGRCEEACPQNIAIAEELEQVHRALFEDPR
ncbi:MAG: aldo/keto reductase [Deferrisomatales bacterium]|nr:aldo/keto reductase [Deferrisomatales bacterium]